MNIDTLDFRKLDFAGLEMLIAWARIEGWNPGPQDAEAFWAADPDGFYGYFHENTLVAGGAIVSYNMQFGFMGLFIVKSEFRSMGIGRKLWQQRRDLLLSRLNKGASIGMDGVLAMQPFYRKGGFEIAYKDERYEKVGVEFEIDSHIAPFSAANFAEILAYDTRCFGFARPEFLQKWIALSGNKNFSYTENGELRGFAVVRKTRIGYKVGPLFADTPAIAEELYKAALNAVSGESLFMDIPVVNTHAAALVRKYQAKYVFECARMYYGKPPKTEIDKVYGITSFELG